MDSAPPNLASLIPYVERFDPSVRSGLSPATPDQLTELQRIAPLPLPPVFREYLALAGLKRGTLLPKFQANIGIEASLELYRETKPEALPAGVFLVGYGVHDIYPEIGLQVADDSAHPTVVAADDEEVIYTLADSLPQLLFQQAFLGHEIMSYPARHVYGLVRGRHTLQEVANVCGDHAFQIQNFSDTQNHCARSKAAAVHIHQISGSAGWLYLGGADESGCLQLGQSINRCFEMPLLRQENSAAE